LQIGKDGPLDENRAFHNNAKGQTPLHSFNTLIKNLHTLHDEILKRKKNEKTSKSGTYRTLRET
jgi:hypothetical protein